MPLAVLAPHPHAPGVAAHLAVLDEGATHVRLDVDFDFLAAVGAEDELVQSERDFAVGGLAGDLGAGARLCATAADPWPGNAR